MVPRFREQKGNACTLEGSLLVPEEAIELMPGIVYWTYHACSCLSPVFMLLSLPTCLPSAFGKQDPNLTGLRLTYSGCGLGYAHVFARNGWWVGWLVGCKNVNSTWFAKGMSKFKSLRWDFPGLSEWTLNATTGILIRGRQKEIWHKQTQKKRGQWDHGGRDWRDVTTSQGTLAASRSGERM